MAGVWLGNWRAAPEARVRLIVCPHAGGAASFYRGWCDSLPASVDVRVVQYPGREDRFNDGFAPSLRSLASDIASVLANADDLPAAIFGHSMGAVIGYEVALRLAISKAQPLLHLYVSGRRAPHKRRDSAVHSGSDQSLLDEITRLGGSSEALQSPELRCLIVPIVRDDYRLIETYEPGIQERLNIPITAFVGDSDTEACIDDMRAWSEYTTGEFQLKDFPGDHFYLIPNHKELILEISSSLLAAVTQNGPSSIHFP